MECERTLLRHRLARRDDLGPLTSLIDAAIAGLQQPYLDRAQIAASQAITGLVHASASCSPGSRPDRLVVRAGVHLDLDLALMGLEHDDGIGGPGRLTARYEGGEVFLLRRASRRGGARASMPAVNRRPTRSAGRTSRASPSSRP